MKILLVNPPWHCLQGLATKAMPLGLCYLAEVLRENGNKCLIYDGDLDPSSFRSTPKIIGNYENYYKMLEIHTAWSKAENIIREYKPDICGVTFSTGAYGSAKKMTDIVKKCDANTVVILGGPHPTLLPEVLREINADIVVRGEGELTLLEVVNHLKDNLPLSDILGITYKQEDGQIKHNPSRPPIENLDWLPFPARDIILEKEKYTQAPIIGSRGCPFSCTFCASQKIWGRKVRYRSPENIVSEIEKVVSEFGIRNFRFNDDTFTLNEARIIKLCSLLIEKKLDIKWVCYGRVDLISKTIVTEMKKAGCVGMYIGVESGDPQILKSTRKGITVEQVKRCFKMVQKVGIPASAYFMIGFPEEAKEQVLKSIKLMKKIDPKGFVCWSIVTPYPGTHLYDIAKRKNLLPEKPNWSEFFHHSEKINLSNIPQNELFDLVNTIGEELKRRERKRHIREKLRFFCKHPILLYERLSMAPHHSMVHK